MKFFWLTSVIVILICTACSAADEEEIIPEPTIETLQEAIEGGAPYDSEEERAITHLADDIADKLSNPRYGPDDKRTLALELDQIQHPNLPLITFPPLSAEEFSETFKEVERLVEVSVEHGELGEVEEVLKLSIEILEKHEILFGPNSELILAALENVGVWYAEAEQFTKAEELHLRGARIIQMRHGAGYKESFHYAYASESLVTLYINTSAYAKAKPIAEQILKSFEKYLGPNHYKLGPVLVQLGEIYHNDSEAKKAENFMLRAIKIYENMANKDQAIHELHIEALEALSSVYAVDFHFKSQFEAPADVEHIWDKVLKTNEQAKDIAVVNLGVDHLYTRNLIKGISIYSGEP